MQVCTMQFMDEVLEASFHCQGYQTPTFQRFSSFTGICRINGMRSCLTLYNPMNCGLPGSSVHGILQARILGWVAIPFSRESSQPRDWTQVFCTAGGFFTIWATREAPSFIYQIRSDPLLSRVWLFATPWIAAHQASLSITNSRNSPRLTSIESVMPSSHLILCRPLLLLYPIPPSIRVFSNESTLHMRWPKYIYNSLFRLFSIIVYYRILNLAPCAVQ